MSDSYVNIERLKGGKKKQTRRRGKMKDKNGIEIKCSNCANNVNRNYFLLIR